MKKRLVALMTAVVMTLSMSMTAFAAAPVATGDENYVRVARLAAGLGYDTGNQWSDPAVTFVRGDYSKNALYQQTLNDVVTLINSGNVKHFNYLPVTYYISGSASRAELENILNNLSVDLMKQGIVNDIYFGLSNVEDYALMSLEQAWTAQITCNINGGIEPEDYEMHPEVRNYIGKTKVYSENWWEN